MLISPLYVGDYITDDTHLRYQLSDQKDAVLFGIGALQETGVDHEGNPVTTIGGYTVPKIRNGKEYTDIIDLSTIAMCWVMCGCLPISFMGKVK